MALDRVTIYDVAREAGVAISTVSRVMNESPEVSDATRSRVQAAIERLQFQPDRTAKALASQQTTSVTVALPSATSLFYVEILKGVKDVLREHDMDLLLGNLGSAAPQFTLQRFLARGAVDALLVVSLPIDERLADQLRRMRAPVVLVDANHPDFDAFYWDDEAGARMATEHLIELGHERIGMIAAQPWSTSTAGRRAGYQNALEAVGLPFEERLVVTGETTKHAGYSEEAGAEALTQLLALDDPPTAVFASSDVQAYGAWAAARDRGLVIPDDLSIVGYDDLKLSRYLNLTTVDQQMHQIGRRATERVLARIQTPTPERIHQQIPTTLAVRGSTAPPKKLG